MPRSVTFGSYTDAGRALGLTRSAVGKAVMELEQILGARLLERTTRRVGPSEAGLSYRDRCLDILARIEKTELQVSRLHDEPRGLLRVNAPMSFGMLYLGEAIAAFMAAYPDLNVEMSLNDRLIDPVEEGVDVTIRIAALADSSLITRKFAAARCVLVASPAYLAAHGTPKTAGDLTSHRWLAYGAITALQRWSYERADGSTSAVALRPVLSSNNGHILRLAALAGQGITELPTFLVGCDIAAGSLALVRPEHSRGELGV